MDSSTFDVRDVPYEDYSDRQLAAIPLTLLAIALIVLGGWYVATGAPVTLGLDFVGGTEVKVAAEDGVAQEDVADAFSAEPTSVQKIPSDGTYVVTFRKGDLSGQQVQSEAEAAGLEVRSISTVSASFGAETQHLTIIGIAAAFGAMSLLVFALFRSFIPSLAVVASAFSDLVIPMAVMNLLGIKLTLGTVAALLMLIGYSVDSDLLLNDYVFRRPGDFYESSYTAMQTGVTMTLTSMTAMFVMAVSAYFVGIQLLTSMGAVLFIGLCVDLLNTYLLNYSLLRWYKFEGVGR